MGGGLVYRRARLSVAVMLENAVAVVHSEGNSSVAFKIVELRVHTPQRRLSSTLKPVVTGGLN